MIYYQLNLATNFTINQKFLFINLMVAITTTAANKLIFSFMVIVIAIVFIMVAFKNKYEH
jgi:hypothetical protein